MKADKKSKKDVLTAFTLLDTTAKKGESGVATQKHVDSHAEHIDEVSAHNFNNVKDETLVLDEILEQDEVSEVTSSYLNYQNFERLVRKYKIDQVIILKIIG